MRYPRTPEPILQHPIFAAGFAQNGHQLPTYSYALNNPIRFTDPDGLVVRLDNFPTGEKWNLMVDAKMKMANCPCIVKWFEDCFGIDPFTSKEEFIFQYDDSSWHGSDPALHTNWITSITTVHKSAFNPHGNKTNTARQLASDFVHELSHNVSIKTNDSQVYLGFPQPQGKCSAAEIEHLAYEVSDKGCAKACCDAANGK